MTTRYMPVVDYAQIEASAPGRIILMGEFAELYEKNSIAMTIDLRTRVTIRPHKEGRLRLNLKNFNSVREWPVTSFTMTGLVNKYADVLEYTDKIPPKLNHLLHKRYYQTTPSEDPAMLSGSEDVQTTPEFSTKQADDGTMAFLILYVSLGDSFAKSARPPLDIEVESEIPIGRGLGSSSAYGVALCAALMKVFRVSAEPYVLGNWALNIDKFFHGATSGLTTSNIIHGGYIYFQHNKVKAYGVEHLAPIKVMLIDTGIRKNPKTVNEQLADQAKIDPRVVTSFCSISEMASQAWRKINDPDFAPKSLAGFLTANQELLDLLGLGNEVLANICTRAQQLKLVVKQTHCGETAFLLYDGSDDCSHMMEFRNVMTERSLTFSDHNIDYAGLLVEITPDSPDKHNGSSAKRSSKIPIKIET